MVFASRIACLLFLKLIIQTASKPPWLLRSCFQLPRRCSGKKECESRPAGQPAGQPAAQPAAQLPWRIRPYPWGDPETWTLTHIYTHAMTCVGARESLTLPTWVCMLMRWWLHKGMLSRVHVHMQKWMLRVGESYVFINDATHHCMNPCFSDQQFQQHRLSKLYPKQSKLANF